MFIAYLPKQKISAPIGAAYRGALLHVVFTGLKPGMDFQL
jgi:hypothetical protein